MKSVFSFFIIFMMAFRPLMPFADYALNYNYISQELCKNKSRPQLLCNGKCYLKKELAKTLENPVKNGSKSGISHFADVFVAQDAFSFHPIIPINSDNSYSNAELSLCYKFSLFSKIFHPPLI